MGIYWKIDLLSPLPFGWEAGVYILMRKRYMCPTPTPWKWWISPSCSTFFFLLLLCPFCLISSLFCIYFNFLLSIFAYLPPSFSLPHCFFFFYIFPLFLFPFSYFFPPNAPWIFSSILYTYIPGGIISADFIKGNKYDKEKEKKYKNVKEQSRKREVKKRKLKGKIQNRQK